MKIIVKRERPFFFHFRKKEGLKDRAPSGHLMTKDRFAKRLVLLKIENSSQRKSIDENELVFKRPDSSGERSFVFKSCTAKTVLSLFSIFAKKNHENQRGRIRCFQY